MALLLLLLLTSLSFSPATSQFPTTHTPPPPPIDFTRSAGILLAVFVTAIFFLTIFTIYMRCFVHRSNNTPVPTRPAPRPRRGLEDSAIEALPAVIYSDVKDHKIGRDALECAVCLCEFEDHETLKLLPKCDHVFHSDCIATWLSAHVTCPVCRFDLSAVDEVVVEPEVELTSDLVDPEVVREETPPRTPPVVESSPRMRSPIDFGRLGSMSLWSFRGWRSRSARPGRYWTDEERGRFTLRLPESVRRELLAGRMRRSASVAVVFSGESSNTRGYRIGRNGGRSLKLSDRWSFITRNLSFTGGEGSIKRESGVGPSRTRSIREGRGPLDCLGGGGGGGGGSGDGRSDDERSTVAFATV